MIDYDGVMIVVHGTGVHAGRRKCDRGHRWLEATNVGVELAATCPTCGDAAMDWDGKTGVETKLMSVERWHIERLKTIATRLREAGKKYAPLNAHADFRICSGELHDAATDIITVVRFAESIEALRGPGEPYVHMSPRKP